MHMTTTIIQTALLVIFKPAAIFLHGDVFRLRPMGQISFHGQFEHSWCSSELGDRPHVTGFQLVRYEICGLSQL